jgi:hypothetical protein
VRHLALEAQQLLRLLAPRQLRLGAQALPVLEARLEEAADVVDALDRPLLVLVRLVLDARQLGLIGEGDGC